jgi:cell division transport system permease protein
LPFAATGRSLSRAVRQAAVGAREQPLIQLVAVGTIALTLLLVAAFALCACNVRRIAAGVGGLAQMTVYLEDGAAPERAQLIASALARLPGVTAVRSVSQREAYERLRRSLGARGELLTGVEEGYLPASLEVSLQAGVAEVIRAHPAFERLRHAVGVEEVDLLGDFGSKLQALERMLVGVGCVVGLLVVCACLYIVASTIRLGVFARRDEIEILKLVGATDRFVKAPFLIEGAAQGAIGTALALALLYLGYHQAAPRVDAVLAAFAAAGPLRFFSPSLTALAIAGGALLGLAGSSLALGRYVRV